jgi:hypothetical protein
VNLHKPKKVVALGAMHGNAEAKIGLQKLSDGKNISLAHSFTSVAANS